MTTTDTTIARPLALPLALRHGRRYRQKDGAVSGLVEPNTGPNADRFPFAIAGGYSDHRFYTADGRESLKDADYDLVEEVA